MADRTESHAGRKYVLLRTYLHIINGAYMPYGVVCHSIYLSSATLLCKFFHIYGRPYSLALYTSIIEQSHTNQVRWQQTVLLRKIRGWWEEPSTER